MSCKSPQFIADHLNSLPIDTLRFEVVPFLLADDEEVLHDIISMFIHAIFKNRPLAKVERFVVFMKDKVLRFHQKQLHKSQIINSRDDIESKM